MCICELVCVKMMGKLSFGYIGSTVWVLVYVGSAGMVYISQRKARKAETFKNIALVTN